MSDDLGARYVVEAWPGLRCYQVVDLATDKPKGPQYLHHADAARAAALLNHPASQPRPTAKQGDLFQPQEA